jgi:hypothetical protein
MKQFTVADPRTFEGDPFEVAERAVRQAGAIAEVLQDTLASTRLMVRNAQLERELLTDGECDAAGFDESPQGRKLSEIVRTTEGAIKSLNFLVQAASYNPKHPPRIND